MRDCQLLFEPYSTDQIIEILESKVNSRYSSLPTQIKDNAQLKSLFFALIDDRAYEIIAKKVAKQSGDIRVAFDLLASALSLLKKQLSAKQEEELNLDKIRVTYQTILHVDEVKNGSKIGKTLKSQPRQNLMILRSLSKILDHSGEEKVVSFSQVYQAVGQKCLQHSLERMCWNEFNDCIGMLDGSFIRVYHCKKDFKSSQLILQVDLNELVDELHNLNGGNNQQ